MQVRCPLKMDCVGWCNCMCDESANWLQGASTSTKTPQTNTAMPMRRKKNRHSESAAPRAFSTIGPGFSSNSVRSVHGARKQMSKDGQESSKGNKAGLRAHAKRMFRDSCVSCSTRRQLGQLRRVRASPPPSPNSQWPWEHVDVKATFSAELTTWCEQVLLIGLIESSIGSGLCWLFQNLTSWPNSLWHGTSNVNNLFLKPQTSLDTKISNRHTSLALWQTTPTFGESFCDLYQTWWYCVWGGGGIVCAVRYFFVSEPQAARKSTMRHVCATLGTDLGINLHFSLNVNMCIPCVCVCV